VPTATMAAAGPALVGAKLSEANLSGALSGRPQRR
jgi:hypothetical protein